MTSSLSAEGLRVTLSDRERRFTLFVDRFHVTEGEAIGLTGPSGTGKTLLLELLGLLRRPDAGGRYVVAADGRGQDLAEIWTRRDGRSRISALRGGLFGFVPQRGGLLDFLTVRDNVTLSQRICGRPDPAFAGHLMERLGLSGLAGLLPAQLSIGQRQRVSIARALAHRPRYVIADEPTAALDPENAATAMGLLFDAAKGSGSSVIVSSHDINLLDAFALTRYRLRFGGAGDGAQVVSRLVAEAETVV
jgi:putative ABC transport system ATP-binding protein